MLPPATGGRTDLLAQIQKGKKLKKTIGVSIYPVAYCSIYSDCNWT
jgi:hypothetical protein